MSILRGMADGLVNVVANLGTDRDKAAHTRYVGATLPAAELIAMYRTSWLAAAIVDYPAEDATRKWRLWRAPAEQIGKIEALEKALHLPARVQEAMVAARLYGGAAIFINTDAASAEPIPPGREIKSLVVLTANQLTPGAIVRDIGSAYYGRPEFYTLQGNGAPVKIHASHLAVFHGAKLPADAAAMVAIGWGDSVLQGPLDAIRNMDASAANVASLIFEAKVDIIKFKNFADILANGGDDVVVRRMQAQAAMKGINGAVVIDADDDYDQKTASFGSLPEVLSKFMDLVAGAARVPVTRLFGRAAAGLSGSGDGDERVYYDRIGHLQATDIAPALAILDDMLITQALGSRPGDIYYEWAPLRQMTESERAGIFGQTAAAARALAGGSTGELVPLDALSDALVNSLTEMGALPGLEAAVEKYGSLAEQGQLVGEDHDEDS